MNEHEYLEKCKDLLDRLMFHLQDMGDDTIEDFVAEYRQLEKHKRNK